MFTSRGELYKKTRKIEETVNGKTSTIYEAFYDSAGKLVKDYDTKEGRETVYRGLENGGREEITNYKDGKTHQRIYDSKARLIYFISNKGRFKQVYGDNKGEYIRVVSEGATNEQKLFFLDNKIVKKEWANGIVEFYDEFERIKEITGAGYFSKRIYSKKNPQDYLTETYDASKENLMSKHLTEVSSGNEYAVIFKNKLPIKVKDFKNKSESMSKPLIMAALSKIGKYETN